MNLFGLIVSTVCQLLITTANLDVRFAFFQLFFVFLKGAKIKQNPSFDEVFMQQLEGFCGPYNPTNILEILLILSTFK